MADKSKGTRIMFSADHHFDESRRFGECIRMHEWMLQQARDGACDAFVSCGDIYERASTPRERDAVSQWLQAMARVCPVFIVKGNHDRHLDCAIMGKLASEHPIIVCESYGVYRVGDVSLALVAWPERAAVLQWAESQGVAPDVAASDALRALLVGLRLQLEQHEGPRILAGHFMVDGAVTSVGQPLLGQPMRVTLGDLALAEADIVVMGHVHKPQEWKHGRSRILYTGSPYRTSYGEVEDKSVVVVDAARDVIGFMRVTTPCRPMFLCEDVWTLDEGFERGASKHVPEPKDAEIRFRYAVHPDARAVASEHADKYAQRWLAAGAHDVKLDEVVITTARARAPELAAAQTLEEKLYALWRAQGDVPTKPRDQHLVKLAYSLEQEGTHGEAE